MADDLPLPINRFEIAFGDALPANVEQELRTFCLRFSNLQCTFGIIPFVGTERVVADSCGS